MECLQLAPGWLMLELVYEVVSTDLSLIFSGSAKGLRKLEVGGFIEFRVQSRYYL